MTYYNPREAVTSYFGMRIVGWLDALTSSSVPYALINIVALLGFLSYTAYCSAREDLFATLWRILQWHWGRQVTADLYIGISIFLFLVYLNDGPTMMLLWLLPAVAFVNLASLVYLVINYDVLVARFL